MCIRDSIDTVHYLVNEMSKYLPLKDVVTFRGIQGQAPVHIAALYGHLEIVKFFVTELNCDPNIMITSNVPGRILLHNAAQGGHLHIVKFLIEVQNCNPLHLDKNKVTPLHLAAGKGHLDVVKYLTLEQHCDPLCTDKDKNTPLHYAVRDAGCLEAVSYTHLTLPTNREV